jgi:hypothetical protein
MILEVRLSGYALILIASFLLTSIKSIKNDIIIRPNYIEVETSPTPSTTTTTTEATTTRLRRTLSSIKNLKFDINNDVKITRIRLALISERTDCNNTLKLFWNINNHSIDLIGYQIFVREYKILEENTEESIEQGLSTNRFKLSNGYNSKIIGPNQNRFKLKNLLRPHKTLFSICLVIFVDSVERVLLEKKCINLTLPEYPREFLYSDTFCSASETKTKSTTKSTTQKSTTEMFFEYTTENYQTQSTSSSKSYSEFSSKIIPYSILKNRTMSYKHNKLFQSGNSISSTPSVTVEKYAKKLNNSNQNGSNGTELSHFLSFTNQTSLTYMILLVAFVICIALLSANVFMFTVIIIQNGIKLRLVRSKIKLNKINNDFYCLSNDSTSYSLSHNNNNVNINKRNDYEIEETRKLKTNDSSKCCCFSSFCRFFAKICCDCAENVENSANVANKNFKHKKSTTSKSNIESNGIKKTQKSILKRKKRTNSGKNNQASRKDIPKKLVEKRKIKSNMVKNVNDNKPSSNNSPLPIQQQQNKPPHQPNKFEHGAKFKRPSIIQSVSSAINRDGYILNLPPSQTADTNITNYAQTHSHTNTNRPNLFSESNTEIQFNRFKIRQFNNNVNDEINLNEMAPHSHRINNQNHHNLGQYNQHNYHHHNNANFAQQYHQHYNYNSPSKPPRNINYKSSFSNDIFFHVPQNRFHIDSQISSAF